MLNSNKINHDVKSNQTSQKQNCRDEDLRKTIDLINMIESGEYYKETSRPPTDINGNGLENVFDDGSGLSVENTSGSGFDNIFDDESVQSLQETVMTHNEFENIFDCDEISKEATTSESQQKTVSLEINGKLQEPSKNVWLPTSLQSGSKVPTNQEFPGAIEYGHTGSNFPPRNLDTHLLPKASSTLNKNQNAIPMSFEQRNKLAEMAGKRMSFEKGFSCRERIEEPLIAEQPCSKMDLTHSSMTFDQRLKQTEMNLMNSMMRSEKSREHIRHLIHHEKAQKRHSLGHSHAMEYRKRPPPASLNVMNNPTRRRFTMKL